MMCLRLLTSFRSAEPLLLRGARTPTHGARQHARARHGACPATPRRAFLCVWTGSRPLPRATGSPPPPPRPPPRRVRAAPVCRDRSLQGTCGRCKTQRAARRRVACSSQSFIWTITYGLPRRTCGLSARIWPATRSHRRAGHIAVPAVTVATLIGCGGAWAALRPSASSSLRLRWARAQTASTVHGRIGQSATRAAACALARRLRAGARCHSGRVAHAGLPLRLGLG